MFLNNKINNIILKSFCEDYNNDLEDAVSLLVVIIIIIIIVIVITSVCFTIIVFTMQE
jgi:hypothetical protein